MEQTFAMKGKKENLDHVRGTMGMVRFKYHRYLHDV